MGTGHSKQEQVHLKAAIQKLSKVELSYIDKIFKELSYHTDKGESLIRKPTWLNRDTFPSKFGLPDFLVECLFAAFDRDQNGTIDVEEFLSGMALCLHGRVKDKCRLLFKIFNLDDDEGIMREEFATVLSTALLSANAVLQSILTQEEDKSEDTFEKVKDTVKRIVDDTFETCDTSRNGKLEIDEFVKWVHKNPKLVDNVCLLMKFWYILRQVMARMNQ